MSLSHRIVLAAASLALGATTAHAAVTYAFNIDTSSLAGSNGFIELQFANGGGGPLVAQEATATISGFQGAALSSEDPYTSSDLFGAPNVFGHVSGTLPGAVVMDEITTNFDDYLHALQFGDAISFQLTLAGPAIDASICTGASSCSLPGFSLDFLNADGSQFLLSDFLVGQVEVNRDGSTTPITFPTSAGGPSALTIAAIPEPATWALMLAGFGAVGVGLRHRRRAAFS